MPCGLQADNESMGTGTILIVDESLLARAWTARVVTDKGYRVATATDTAGTLSVVREQEPDVLVVRDGPGGRRLVDALRKNGVCSGIVMLTATGNDEAAREALRVGADDVVPAPCSEQAVIRAVAAAQRRGHGRTARQARELQLDGEVRAAAAIQAALVPDTPPLDGDWQIEHGFLPASEVGGDFFDLFRSPRGSLFLALGDVSGKGVGAALLAAMAQTALRAAVMRGDGPAAALTAANAVLFEPLGRAGRFLTGFAAELDPATGTLSYADAGHGHHLLLGGDDAERPLPVGGPPLGLMPDASYSEGVETLEAGARLAVFSDGLVEGRDETDGVRAALVDAVRRRASPTQLVTDAPDQDDRTLIVVERAA
jgi:phosphoserine phosphatase RsbU/P